MKSINEFSGEYRFLSNFYPSTIVYNGLTYPTGEHAYQAAKTDNVFEIEEILNSDKPSDAKALGKKVNISKYFEQNKLGIMLDIQLYKYLYNKDLQDKLLSTGYISIIEGNRWGDIYWGVCGGEGKNYLGKILMDVRSFIRISKKLKN